MDDKAIRSQLEAMLRAEDDDFVAARKVQQDRLAAMSDDEWWDQIVSQTKDIRPQMIEVFERNKTEMISGRHKPAKQEVEFREKTIQRKTLDLLPFVMELRNEEGATGNLTKNQLHVASMRLSSETTRSMIQKMEGSIDKQANPRKREILEKFVWNAQQNRAELESLQDLDNLTEERLKEVTKHIVDRTDQLTEWMKTKAFPLRPCHRFSKGS